MGDLHAWKSPFLHRTYSRMQYLMYTSNTCHMKEDHGKGSDGEMKLGGTRSR